MAFYMVSRLFCYDLGGIIAASRGWLKVLKNRYTYLRYSRSRTVSGSTAMQIAVVTV